jgi:predicted AAA+ superfamily ATPase
MVMQKKINTTGFCRPKMHYMVDPLRGFEKAIYRLISKEEYFTIHAPRQTGKTTLLHALAHKLNDEGEYVSTVFSVENAGYRSITEQQANKKIISSLFTTSQFF